MKKKRPQTRQRRPDRPLLSLVMIVKDEEKYLPRCLLSARGLVDEAIVVDTGSGDRTVQIARRMGATVCHFSWNNDFSAARNYALAQAHGRWVLHLDADEEIDASSLSLIREIAKQELDSPVSYLLAVRNYRDLASLELDGILLQPRLFYRHPLVTYVRPIHEVLTTSDPTVPLRTIARPDIAINHFGYATAVVLARKKIERNLAAAEAALETDPEDPYSYYDMGRLQQALGNAEKALPLYMEAVRLADSRPTSTTILADSIASAALLQSRMGRREAALQLAAQGLKTVDSAYLWWTLASIELKGGQREEGISHLQEALKRVDERGEAAIGLSVTRRSLHLQMAQALQDKGEPEQAREHLEKALNLGAQTPEIHFALGGLCANLGLSNDAIYHLSAYLDKSASPMWTGTRDPDIHFHKPLEQTQAMACLLLSKVAADRDKGAALEWAERAARLDKGLLDAQAQKARVLASLNRPQEAYDLLYELLQKDLTRADLWLEIAALLREEEEAEAALSVLAEAIGHVDNDPRIYQMMGSLLLKLRRYEDSANAFQLALYYRGDVALEPADAGAAQGA